MDPRQPVDPAEPPWLDQERPGRFPDPLPDRPAGPEAPRANTGIGAFWALLLAFAGLISMFAYCVR